MSLKEWCKPQLKNLDVLLTAGNDDWAYLLPLLFLFDDDGHSSSHS